MENDVIYMISIPISSSRRDGECIDWQSLTLNSGVVDASLSKSVMDSLSYALSQIYFAILMMPCIHDEAAVIDRGELKEVDEMDAVAVRGVFIVEGCEMSWLRILLWPSTFHFPNEWIRLLEAIRRWLWPVL
jgi:hypothetical protein